MNQAILNCKNIKNIKIKFNLDEKNKINNFLNTIKNFGINIKNDFFMSSNILNTEEKKLLIEWLPKRPNKIIPLLNSNKDGDSIQTFIDRTKNMSPTLVVIMTTKGQKFGGYTSKEWKKGGNTDSDAFVFS